jgi:hypothetical protein
MTVRFRIRTAMMGWTPPGFSASSRQLASFGVGYQRSTEESPR